MHCFHRRGLRRLHSSRAGGPQALEGGNPTIRPGERLRADSIAVRAFLNYALQEDSPERSSLSRIRQPLGPKVYRQVFTLILAALQAHGLVKGEHEGVDSSVMAVNASLRGLVNRNTDKAYWDYVWRRDEE